MFGLFLNSLSFHPISPRKAARKAGKRGSTHELDANSAAMARERGLEPLEPRGGCMHP